MKYILFIALIVLASCQETTEKPPIQEDVGNCFRDVKDLCFADAECKAAFDAAETACLCEGAPAPSPKPEQFEEKPPLEPVADGHEEPPAIASETDIAACGDGFWLDSWGNCRPLKPVEGEEPKLPPAEPTQEDIDKCGEGFFLDEWYHCKPLEPKPAGTTDTTTDGGRRRRLQTTTEPPKDGTQPPPPPPSADEPPKEWSPPEGDTGIENTDGTKSYEDGSIQHPNGDISHPDGTMTDKDGNLWWPDGTKQELDGTVTYPDGTEAKPDGTTVYADGTEIKQNTDGTITTGEFQEADQKEPLTEEQVEKIESCWDTCISSTDNPILIKFYEDNKACAALIQQKIAEDKATAAGVLVQFTLAILALVLIVA